MMIPKSIESKLTALRKNNVSGANELVSKALLIINDQLVLIKNPKKNVENLFYELFKQLVQTRPSMAPLINVIGFFINNLSEYTKETISQVIKKFHTFRLKMNSQLEQNFQSFLKNISKSPLKLMLISYSSTILDLIQKQQGITFRFYILESRPLFEGRRLAEILSKDYETHLFIDAALGKFISKIDLVLIGVDSILQDGSIINKIGTYPLACIANVNNKKVYAIGDSFKYNLKSHYGQKVFIERKLINEVYDKPVHNENFHIENYYFDITPPKLIDGIISDLGILTIQKFLNKVKKDLPINWYKSFI